MSVPLALRGLLEREPSHGYDLKRDYDTFFGRGKPLPFGQVYSTLGRLARDGMIRHYPSHSATRLLRSGDHPGAERPLPEASLKKRASF